MKLCLYCNKPIEQPKSNQKYHLNCSNIVFYRRGFYKDHPAAAKTKCPRCNEPIIRINGHVVDPISLNASELRCISIGGEVDYDHKRHELHRCPSLNLEKL